MSARTGFLSGLLDWLAPERTRTPAYEAGERRYADEPGWNTLGDRQSVPHSLIALSQKHYASDGYYRNGCDAWTTALAGSGWGFAPRDPDTLTAWTAYAGRATWGGGSFDSLTGQLARDMVVSGEGVAILQPDWTWLRIPRGTIASDHDNGTTIREGVEFEEGRESAIWIRRDPASAPERVERDRYVRLWREDFPGQIRGAPWGAAVLNAADTLADTENALLMGVKVAAMFAGIATDENNAGSEFPFDGTSHGSVLESGLEPGTLKILPAGWRVQFATPQQAQQSSEFLRHQLNRISAGFGVPTHLVSNNLADANYGSLRAGMVEFSMRVEAAQFATIVPQFLKPAWEAFAAREYLAGRVADLEQAMACEFIAPARPWIDPAKDAAATAEMLRLGLTSRRRAAAELGWDIARLDAEIVSDRERESALGLSFNQEAQNA
jgi:capsid protein